MKCADGAGCKADDKVYPLETAQPDCVGTGQCQKAVIQDGVIRNMHTEDHAVFSFGFSGIDIAAYADHTDRNEDEKKHIKWR